MKVHGHHRIKGHISIKWFIQTKLLEMVSICCIIFIFYSIMPQCNFKSLLVFSYIHVMFSCLVIIQYSHFTHIIMTWWIWRDNLFLTHDLTYCHYGGSYNASFWFVILFCICHQVLSGFVSGQLFYSKMFSNKVIWNRV